MSQDARRIAAARSQLEPPARTDADVPERLRLPRFSEGVERAPGDRFRVARFGTFATGLQRPGDTAVDASRIGRFSRGQDHLQGGEPAALHVGAFGDRSDAGSAA